MDSKSFGSGANTAQPRASQEPPQAGRSALGQRQEPAASVRWVAYPGRVILVAAVYFATAKLSLLLAIPPGYATAVWPPSGIALAATLLLGYRIWPGIWLGAVLVNLTVKASVVTAVLIGTGNTLEALAGAALIRHFVGTPYRFERGEDVVKFVALAALACTIAATIAVASLTLEGSVSRYDFFPNWWTWWQGDAAGIIIVTPLVLSWYLREAEPWPPAKILEAACFASLLLFTGSFIFGDDTPYFSPLPLTFAILPFIIWAAFRFSQRVVTTVIAASCAFAVWHTVEGRGPFALESLNLSLLFLQVFVCTVVTTGLVLSAVVGERSRAMERLGHALYELREQAITDPLTGLFNRRYLREFMQREWIRARRRESSLAVIMIDVDYFKRVNDAFGHEAGDLVLAEIAALLKTQIRGSDIACRYGGEEFALVLPDVTLEGVQRRAEAIRAAVMRLELKYRDKPLGRITTSLGIALFPEHAEDPDSLLRASDEALYEAKSAGRDRIVVSPPRQGLPKPFKKTTSE